MDPKTLLALLFVGVFFIGWQMYMQKKYPKQLSENQNVEQAQNGLKETTHDNGGATVEPSDRTHLEVTATEPLSESNIIKQEEVFEYSDENIRFTLSSKGMGLKKVILNKYTNRQGDNYHFDEQANTGIFETGLIGFKNPLDFDVKKVGEYRFVGVAEFDGVKITRSIEIVSDQFLFKTDLKVVGQSPRFLGIRLNLVEEVKEIETSTFMPTFERQEFFTIAEGSDERVFVTKSEPIKESFQKVSVASLGTQYFSQSLVDKSSVVPEFKMKSNPDSAIGTLVYSATNYNGDFSLSFKGFVGPKDLDILESVDGQLGNLIDFGMFSWLARPMLQLMKWFHGIVGNWGVAIIILTLLVRVLVLPFTVMSFKSLNKMKVIQPQIKALKEKYKDDAQKLNQEMMLLMKSNKVNPLGGCLPMLLQFPVFIALYQVLGQSIELYQAPFYFWIQDLSLKDPYYVLPILMAAAMFLQQKLTPNTMDPAQAKMMMFLPVVFALFMMSLPSGLTLYIFVSSLFAIIQQMIFMRDQSNNQAVATA